MKIYGIILSLAYTLYMLPGCTDPAPVADDPAMNEATQSSDPWLEQLRPLCGQAFGGTVMSAPEGDTVFADKALVMHVRLCEEHRIYVPFVVGDDRSRTWVFRHEGGRLELRHEHRHEDGTFDELTDYGGWTTNHGTEFSRFFPADQKTADILPVAAGNVWWIDLEPGSHFTYNLRRMGTERYFSIRFDLATPVEAPEAPWGWE